MTPSLPFQYEIAKKAVAAVASRNGTQFDFGNISETICE